MNAPIRSAREEVLLKQVLPSVELVAEDGENLETGWHRAAMNCLIESVDYHFRDRQDHHAGGNQFIYFNDEQARDRDFRGPDFYFVKGVKREPLRPCWVVWLEGGRYPNVIIELLSASTKEVDLTTKKDVYASVFRTPDYFCYDPETQELLGWHLVDGVYEPLKPNEKGWLWSSELGLWVGTWAGKFQGYEEVWVRFFDPEGRVVPHFAEAAQQLAEAEKQRADSAQQLAEAEKQRADSARLQAEAEAQRAAAAENELALLRARLAALERSQPPRG